MIQVAQLNFREMEHQICLLGINQTISGLLYAGGMDAPEDGGVLAYGYVDTEGGFTFKILAPAKVEGGQDHSSSGSSGYDGEAAQGAGE